MYRSGGQSGTSNVYITLDEEKFTELSFKRCLEFLYTGCVELNKDSEGLEETIKAAKLLNLPELLMICQNAQQDQDFLNPSIGTWLNDRNSAIAKELFLNKPLMSDVKFLVEGEIVYGHKVVLSARCDVLGAMLTGGFAESNSSEVYGYSYNGRDAGRGWGWSWKGWGWKRVGQQKQHNYYNRY